MDSKIAKFPLVILAAGQASRMKIPKGLLNYKGRPWLGEQLKNFKECGGSHAVVVLGAASEDYFKNLSWAMEGKNKWTDHEGLKVAFVINPHPERGQFSSIQTALGFMAKEKRQGAFILPVDVPVAAKPTWEVLSETLKSGLRACLPVHEEKGGHPVLLSQSFAHSLLTLDPDDKDSRLDVQIRLLDKTQFSRVTVNDFRVIKNLNGPEEWQQYIESN